MCLRDSHATYDKRGIFFGPGLTHAQILHDQTKQRRNYSCAHEPPRNEEERRVMVCIQITSTPHRTASHRIAAYNRVHVCDHACARSLRNAHVKTLKRIRNLQHRVYIRVYVREHDRLAKWEFHAKMTRTTNMYLSQAHTHTHPLARRGIQD